MTETVGKRRYSRGGTPWAYAYNVHSDRRYLGLVYRGSDEKWHAIALDGAREGGFERRSDAAFFLEQPR